MLYSAGSKGGLQRRLVGFGAWLKGGLHRRLAGMACFWSLVGHIVGMCWMAASLPVVWLEVALDGS